MADSGYCGRLAPTPSGDLHLGHALTFHSAWRRARAAGGRLRLRIEDVDAARCKPAYFRNCLEDLRWLGLDWDGDPLFQSQRGARYLEIWQRLRTAGWIYPCHRSRRELRALGAADTPDEQDAEPLYPAAWRPPAEAAELYPEPGGLPWRFRVPEGETIRFRDARLGDCAFVAGRDFGDFVVWRREGIAAYELAVVVDDLDQAITEVVRGADLLRSTARQLLLYRALESAPPSWCHEPLVRDQNGRRLAKRDQSLSLRALREAGKSPEEVLTLAAAATKA